MRVLAAVAVVSALVAGCDRGRGDAKVATRSATTTTTELAATTAPPSSTTVTVATPAPATSAPAAATTTSSPEPVRVLAFTRTTGFRHDSIPAAAAAATGLGRQAGMEVDVTEDAAAFSDANLRRYRAVVFLLTTGDVLDAAQEAAVERFIRAGGGFAGVHSATDTEYDWPFYGELVGARFKAHPAIQPADVLVEDGNHPSTAGLPSRWPRTDEWYDFRDNPRNRVHVLLTVDPATYSGSTMGPDHPIAWCHRVGRGRAWYTAMGHTSETYSEAHFRSHFAGGLRYAAGTSPGPTCG